MSALDPFTKLTTQKTSRVSGLSPAAITSLVAGLFLQKQQSILIVLPSNRQLERFLEDLTFFLGSQSSVAVFPSLDVLPYYQLSPHPDVLTARLKVLYQLLTEPKHRIVLTTHDALMRRLPPRKIFQDYAEHLLLHTEIDRHSLVLKLHQAGYLSVPLVEDAGTFSVRGDVLDLFPPHSEMPYRLEFFGDQIESIRVFEPSTQRSLAHEKELLLLPARELILNDETLENALPQLKARFDEIGSTKSEREQILDPLKNKLSFAGIESFLTFFYPETSSLLDYLKIGTQLIQIDPSDAAIHSAKQKEELIAAHKAATGPERHVQFEEIFWDDSAVAEKISRFHTLSIEPFVDPIAAEKIDLELITETNLLLPAQVVTSEGIKTLEPLIEFLKDRAKAGQHVLLVASSETQKHRLIDLLERHELKPEEMRSPPIAWMASKNPSSIVGQAASRGGVWICTGHLSEGFQIRGESFLFITDSEIFGGKKRRPQKTQKLSEVFTAFEDLKENDYIVHVQHGVGIYRKLITLNLGGLEGEFLLLEYQGADKLYLPVYRLSQIQRYTGEHGQIPTLDKLGSSQWAKTREKAKKSIRAIAGELLKIHAERATRTRPPMLEGGELFEEFEAAFPYEETIDQDQAIRDVIKSLESDQPMDRLICGDVGYGKTEVALRATFKTVLNGMQAAILVPTTILAFQHFETFSRRLKPFGIKVEMLSRFRSSAEQKEILKEYVAGRIDVVVGTHRLLQPDFKPKNLGILIIDEEHRFGVSHKEKIKKIKSLVDVLTLTATPIPRTLNLSLFGIRDISLINTPPADREAIRTYVAQFDEGLIREAVLRELQRGGQVFFVHNRVQSIGAMAERLGKLIPEAKIVVGHGQMDEEELEEVILKFMHKEANLFLSTTIIESGVDFPSANTILINRADTFGLAQLYQLRGRVGRSNLKAYCYLLTPQEVAITQDARSRLALLQRFTDLGSGFKIAAHDLEMRGSGNILGAEQHGHLAVMGYEMYLKLLEETIGEMKGEKTETTIDPELSFKIPAFLPEDYVSDPATRLGLYKRLSTASDLEKIDEIEQELLDRFGKLPETVEHFVEVMRIRFFATRLKIESVQQEKGRALYKFHAETPVSPETFISLLQKQPKKYQLTPDQKLIVLDPEEHPKQLLFNIRRFLEGLSDG